MIAKDIGLMNWPPCDSNPILRSCDADKQKRQAQHIEAGYEKTGLCPKAAESRDWATVNRISSGGKLSGSGRNKN